jgi:hypothetical protein
MATTRASMGAMMAGKGKPKASGKGGGKAKEARSGADMGKPGKGFKKVADKAASEYGSKAAGDRVAGAVFQNMRKAGKL